MEEITEIDVELYDILIPKAEAGKSSPLILHSTPQGQSWYFYMAMKSGLIRIKPEYLRWAMKRGDLWMARYFLLEKILRDGGLDYKHVRDMPKDDIYDVIHPDSKSPTLD